MFGIGESVVVGYDLSNEYAQISYLTKGAEVANTISLRADEEQFNIPACLFKRSEVNQWFYGVEALKYSAVEEGELIGHLYEYALVGEPITVVGEQFDPIKLLQLFVKRSLSLLYAEVRPESIKGIMFTVESLTKRAVEVMEQVVAGLGLPGVRLAMQGREESIYYYVLRQPKEIWDYDVCVFDLSDDCLKSYRFYENKNTKPIVAFVDEEKHSGIKKTDILDLDEKFLEVIKERTAGHIVSGAYLIGDGFESEWYKLSLRELCRNRRVFKGNNMYSRGACYGMADRLAGDNENKSVFFLGKNKLKANVGMEVKRGREESYIALLNGGDNWFDADKECDCILESGNSFEIKIIPLDGKNVRNIEIVLDGLNERERFATRLKIHAFMESDNIIRINVTDMGFGSFYPATNQVFTKEIALYE